MRALRAWASLLAAPLLLVASLATQVRAASRLWTLDGFQGRRIDYAHWLREGHGGYFIDDDPEYEWSGIVNNALLALAFGDSEKAWGLNPHEQLRRGAAARALHDQLLWAVRKAVVPEGASRVWADALEAYLLLEDRFTRAEQREIEEFSSGRAKTYGEAGGQHWGHQYVPHAFAALTGHVLSQSTTGADYKKDIAWLWRYAQEKSYDFGETMGPVEHSGHYVMYTYPAMVRVGIWVDGRKGKLPEEHKPNLKRAVNWLLDAYPPSGFAVTYGTEWAWAHVPRLIEFLHAAAFYLNDGTPENVRLARNAKWLATEMSRFGFQHTARHRTWVEWTPHTVKREPPSGIGIPVEATPLALWRYVDDTLQPERPRSSGCTNPVNGRRATRARGTGADSSASPRSRPMPSSSTSPMPTGRPTGSS